MSKKLTFDALPGAVEKILERLTDGENGHSSPTEILQRLTLIEKKIDDLQRTVTPNRPSLDLKAVCRILKIRPKAAYELAASGVLPAHSEGRKTLFYEDDVVKYYMGQPAWSAVSARSEEEKPAGMPLSADGRQRIGVETASRIVGRSAAAIYQMTGKNRIPCHRDGSKKVYFFENELREWLTQHPPRPRRAKGEQ